MNEQLYDVVEICMKLMDEGASLEQCLGRFPTLAEELRPILMAAYAAKSLADPTIPIEAMNRSRTNMSGKAARLRQERSPRGGWMGVSKLAFSLVILAVLLVLTSSSLYVASAKSLPGDTLYPVKWVVANFQVKMADGVEKRSEVEAQLRLQRIGEVQQLLDRKLVREITFQGIVERITADQWQVSNIRVRVSNNSVIIGSVSEGMLVEVEGLTEKQGTVSAHKIQLREFQVTGLVEKISSNEWIISGMLVDITPETQLSVGINEGDMVLALIYSDENDQSWVAKAILNLGKSTQDLIPSEIKSSPTESTGPGLDDDELSDDDDSEEGSMDDDGGGDDIDKNEIPMSTDDDDGDDSKEEEGEDQEQAPESEGASDDDSESDDEVGDEDDDPSSETDDEGDDSGEDGDDD